MKNHRPVEAAIIGERQRAMNTKLNRLKTSASKAFALCGLLLAANAALACQCIQLPFTKTGFGLFWTSPQDIAAMGSTSNYLAGTTVTSLTLVTTAWGR